MTKLEKWLWHIPLYLALAFCTVMFAASCAGNYLNSRVMFFMLSMVLLFAVHKIK